MRHHLSFRNFRPSVVEAATALFNEKPWRMTDVLEQRQVAQNFVDAVCQSFRVPSADVVVNASEAPDACSYRPALVDMADAISDSEEATVVAPPCIELGRFSMTTLFFMTRVHVLAQGGAQPVSATDPNGWACSLFYTVKPAMFRARAREGRIVGVTAKDTFTADSWAKLEAAGFVVGDRLTGDHAQWSAVLSPVVDQLPDEEETDEAPLFEVVGEMVYDETTDELQTPEERDSYVTRQYLNTCNRDEVRALAARHNIEGRGRMNKDALIEALLAAGVSV